MAETHIPRSIAAVSAPHTMFSYPLFSASLLALRTCRAWGYLTVWGYLFDNLSNLYPVTSLLYTLLSHSHITIYWDLIVLGCFRP